MSELIELKCKNCGSTDLEAENGVYVCQYCGSRFTLDPSAEAKANQYRDKMTLAMAGSDEDYMNPSDEDVVDGAARRYAAVREYSDKLLEILPNDPYGWAGRIYMRISGGIDSEESVRECIEDARKTLEYAQRYSSDEDRMDIAQFVEGNLRLYRDHILEFLASEKDKQTFRDILQRADELAYE